MSCQVDDRGKRTSGTIRNLSCGGLSLQVVRPVDQGDTIQVSIEPGGQRAPVEVEAIVWHSRLIRDRRSGEKSSLLGLVLSTAGDDYADLLESVQPRTTTARRKPKDPAPRPEPAGRPALPRPKRYRIRLTMSGSPRTRSVVAFADSVEEARQTALAEAGPGWDVLEVEPG